MVKQRLSGWGPGVTGCFDQQYVPRPQEAREMATMSAVYQVPTLGFTLLLLSLMVSVINSLKGGKGWEGSQLTSESLRSPYGSSRANHQLLQWE